MSENGGYRLVKLGEFGERARPLRADFREAALVIGLGQVGLQALNRIHTMLESVLTRRDMQANVRLLAMSRHRSIRQEATLPREERLTLHMDPLNWSDVPGRYASLGVAQWWPHSPRTREVQEDLSRVRAHNRLILFDNAALVSEALYKLMQWLLEAGTGREINLQRSVYVVGSLAEAEGSAMVFDVVSRLRALATDEPVTINGVFSLRAYPDAADPDAVLAMANVYATLREIDAFTLHPEAFRSTLPVIGHSLPQHARARRALDTIFLAEEVNTTADEPPEHTLAELVVTWIAASLSPDLQEPVLPPPIPLEDGNDRFSGYSTIGVSKLALPTRAAMELAAVGLAKATLKAIKATFATTPTGNWAQPLVNQARKAVFDTSLLKSSEVVDRMREWAYEMSAAGLIRKLEKRATRGESARMVELVQAEWRRLERESISEETLESSDVETVADSLRTRISTVLIANLQQVQQLLLESPAELAYARGLGLIWTASALEDLGRQLKTVMPEIQHQLAEAQAAHQLARQELFEAAQNYDAKTSGRFSGGRKGVSAELDACGEAVINATAQFIIAQTRRDTWQNLMLLVDDLREQVRDVTPQVTTALDKLQEFDTACRRAMEVAVGQPPQFPAAVALTENWYTNGTRELAGVGQMQPREMLTTVYKAWVPPPELPPERRLSQFLYNIREAARRMLAGAFQFADLYQFLDQHEDHPAFQQAVAGLPNAATPALIPLTNDKYTPPVPYEVVREMPRAFSALAPVQQGVVRSFVRSPDPDEIAVVRVLHGIMAEALPPLREAYRRAYDRAVAEGTPLHIDRRWDSTMADLVHTSARREISVIWENLYETLPRGPYALQQPLEALVRALGVALDVQETATISNLPPDLRLVVYRLRPFRLKLPPPNCAVLFMHSTRAVEEVAEDIFRAVTPLPLEEQFAFVVNVNGRTDIDQIVEPLRRVDFTVLVLDESDIKHLISARLPTNALRDMILEQVSLTTVSPFFTRGPVPEHMFFGREREINEVRSKLRTHSVALIGGRRIGKTSTLQRIQRMLEPRESEYVPYYLDCHGATQYRSFFWLINRRWQVDVPQDADPVQFEDVVTVLQQRHPNKGIVILFDEVDSLLTFDRRKENQETLFRTFRSLSNEKRCQYVFSGEKWLMRAITNPYSALFNFSQAVRLEPLPPKVVHHLVADPFEMLNIWVEESEQVIDRIYQISAGHPNIVQMICQAMVEELDDDPQNANLLNFEHLDKATSRRNLQEEIVGTIWGQMNPLARLITLSWPEGTRWLSITQIEELLKKIGIERVPPERLERTAKDLELYCFVRPRDNDRLELIPMAFPAILDFMTDKKRQIEIVRRQYESDPEGNLPG
ncbi:MAG: AAA family ATPase [Chloroflexi bacterium]|nr:AAA family ATPase [Chloroflexota bacterium]